MGGQRMTDNGYKLTGKTLLLRVYTLVYTFFFEAQLRVDTCQ